MPGQECPRRRHWVCGPSFLFASWFPVGWFLLRPRIAAWPQAQSQQEPTIMAQLLCKREQKTSFYPLVDFLRGFAMMVKGWGRPENTLLVFHSLTWWLYCCWYFDLFPLFPFIFLGSNFLSFLPCPFYILMSESTWFLHWFPWAEKCFGFFFVCWCPLRQASHYSF